MHSLLLLLPGSCPPLHPSRTVWCVSRPAGCRANGVAVWKLDDPAVLRAEVAARRQEAAQAKVKKAQAKLETKQKELDKLDKLAALPPIPEARVQGLFAGLAFHAAHALKPS